MMTAKRLLGLVGMLGALAIAPVQAKTEVVLHSFTTSKGRVPASGLIRDSIGNLYGTTSGGGTANSGVVYKLDTAHRYRVLYGFTGGEDGRFPNAGLLIDSTGNLYGTTFEGGAHNWGVVYKLDAAGQETVLYSFTGGPDGGNPFANVIRDPAGNLYGTASAGGTANAGVVFKLDSVGNETVLHSFTGGADGGTPRAGVIRDSAGSLYGTARDGGTANAGVVFKLDSIGNETVLHSFTGGADGGSPHAGLISDPDGNFYGTTYHGGGSAGTGVVFKLDANGSETVLHSFTGGADGGDPDAGVIRDPDGNLYGTTYLGGTTGVGVVYKLDATGNETVLYSFTDGVDGFGPEAGVIRDSKGNLYGATRKGGDRNVGVIFEIKP